MTGGSRAERRISEGPAFRLLAALRLFQRQTGFSKRPILG